MAEKSGNAELFGKCIQDSHSRGILASDCSKARWQAENLFVAFMHFQKAF
jgi:hypothetical protein